ncbi:MAG: helix-turn-helix domain-containing protein, partial [Bacteroidales bacterium]
MVATFGEYIKQRRTELGFPLRKVASHLDMDTSTYGKIEREERTLASELMPNLAEILETEYKE